MRSRKRHSKREGMGFDALPREIEAIVSIENFLNKEGAKF